MPAVANTTQACTSWPAQRRARFTAKNPTVCGALAITACGGVVAKVWPKVNLATQGVTTGGTCRWRRTDRTGPSTSNTTRRRSARRRNCGWSRPTRPNGSEKHGVSASKASKTLSTREKWNTKMRAGTRTLNGPSHVGVCNYTHTCTRTAVHVPHVPYEGVKCMMYNTAGFRRFRTSGLPSKATCRKNNFWK